MRVAFHVAASVIALMAAVPSHAQADAQGGKDIGADAESPETGLGEIIVTAQRRSENLQRTAAPVAVVGGGDLRDANVSAFTLLQDLVPALTVEPAPTGNLTFIRGVGNFTLTNNSDPATAFNYDEVYVARPIASDGFFYDLERVEILKGPQGTLYGRNATAGAINVIPVKPRIGDRAGYLTASAGNYSARSLEGAINVPIGDRGALRVSGNLVKHDGYLKDGTSDEDTHAFRVQLLGELTPDLTVRASFDYSHQGGAGVGGSYANRIVFDPATGTYSSQPSGVGLDQGYYSPAAQQFLSTLVYPSIGANATPLTLYPFRNNDFYGVHMNIEWRTPVGTVTVIPSWRNDKLNFAPATGFYVLEDIDTEVRSLEARFASERFSIFDITAGALLYDETLHQILSANLGGAALYQDARYGTKSEAVYLRATAHLNDRLRLTGGIRYTHDRKTVAEADVNLVVVCTVIVNGAPSCPTTALPPFTPRLDQQPVIPPPFGALPIGTSGSILLRLDPTQNDSVSNGEVTYRAAVEYDVTPNSLAYASVETGYRSGGFNPAGSAPYEPEFITAWTMGMKNRLFDNRVRLNLEAFLWKYRNQQLSFTGLDLTGAPANLTDNIGRLTIKGIEAELSVLATSNTLLTADVQYLDTRYKAFVYQAPVLAGFPYTGCPVSLNVANPAVYDVNCTGRSAYNSPKWTANFSARQTIPMGDYKLVISADTQYRSSRYNFFNYVPGQLTGASWRSNAQLAFGPESDRWTISAFVRNIENERTQIFGPQHPFLSTLTVQTQAPRTFGGRLFVKF